MWTKQIAHPRGSRDVHVQPSFLETDFTMCSWGILAPPPTFFLFLMFFSHLSHCPQTDPRGSCVWPVRSFPRICKRNPSFSSFGLEWRLPSFQISTRILSVQSHVSDAICIETRFAINTTSTSQESIVSCIEVPPSDDLPRVCLLMTQIM